ncbi:putative amino-acid permease inda1 [Rosellinia necatrix]|uniref:Putative amino-acid permease inda1 n=1 Tax=Rosellinia necatrix TaxID=77044 RepID=A0A1W2TJT0_ROSNE|nr:putative amino-acid permease inda1 [Rosellinia necatrix]
MSDFDKKEKDASVVPHHDTDSHDEEVGIVHKGAALKTDLKGRHMQMIAVGGAIGAGLFIGSGGALYSGGPASLVIGYLVIGTMLLFTMQALGEMAVMYPVNGAFYTYVVRFIDPSWGFAMGWEYAISWLTILPFELIAASSTIKFWRTDINSAVWVTVFLVVLILIQVFGVRGYGEVEFVLSLIKIAACIGFIILGIIINVGGVGDQGYLGAKYWHDPGAFQHGFNGFAGVFVVAAFSFGGTELVGLAAAESSNPRKAIPLAAKQVFFRILFFYVVNLFILGLIFDSTDERLAKATGSNTRYSPFVLAIQDAGIEVLPSIFNAVITISVISVANSCTFGSTRTMQALAERGMGPGFLSYVDKKGRPLWSIVIQLAFGLLGYVVDAPNGGDAFTWLLALSGLAYFFVWGSCCLAHIRFRMAWKVQGRDLREIPYKAPWGVWGSWIGLFLVAICLIATFYNALYPTPNSTPDAKTFFASYLAAFVAVLLYLFWKVYSRDWSLYIKLHDIDLVSGSRPLDPSEFEDPAAQKGNLGMRIVRSLF